MKKAKQYAFVLSELAGRELKRKYARSYLGVIWSVLNPLLSMVVMSLIFSTMFKRSIENFPVYYLTGVIIWNMFTGATNSAMTALVDNKALMVKSKLPKQIFPLSRMLTSLVNFGYSLLAYVLIVAFFKIVPSVHVLAFPLVVVLLFLFSVGFGYILSILYAFLADIRYLYSILLSLWMYSSAIFYPVEGLSGQMQKAVRANPMYAFIASARGCVMYHEWPSAVQWAQMFGWGIGMYALGKLVFESYKNKIMLQNM